MIVNFLQRLFWMLGLVLLQVMVFNHIHLFGYATPLISVFFLLLFPLGTERWGILLWGFLCGLLCDITSLTLGITMASLTLAAFIQPPLLQLMAPKDSPEDLQPGFDTMGFWGYVRYALVLTVLFVVAYFLVQYFNFFHPLDFAISVISSWALTFVLCLVFEGFRYKFHS